ncbi:hypothetical protein ALC62_00996 [Cyphomyrmex costatus]|uniref:Uncharacterized protein n=1 Tax=Cyphomyrmex costatus TaxID=456900 RepID=A0A151IPS0_9HYME|nr:hypothetical protein ALC62_00996 [Cyphomyrmex costatus]
MEKGQDGGVLVGGKKIWTRSSKYNESYVRIKTEAVPKYLREGGKDKRMIRIARFRMGNEMRRGRYWEDEERRVCRVCGAEEETWDHVLKRCAKWKEDEKEMSMEDILDEGGGGDVWIRGLIGIREKMSIEEEGRRGRAYKLS